jgi:hypothetical protein
VFGLDQEVSMHKLVTSLAAAFALALLASAGQACDFHKTHVTASVPSEEVVAMSTVDEATSPVATVTDATVDIAADIAAAAECPAGMTDCAPAGK